MLGQYQPLSTCHLPSASILSVAEKKMYPFRANYSLTDSEDLLFLLESSADLLVDNFFSKPIFHTLSGKQLGF
jgi:hypothetical protein